MVAAPDVVGLCLGELRAEGVYILEGIGEESGELGVGWKGSEGMDLNVELEHRSSNRHAYTVCRRETNAEVDTAPASSAILHVLSKQHSLAINSVSRSLS